MSENPADEFDGNEVAVVGMALRVPGAVNLDEFWVNLRDGVESVRELSEEELRDGGVSEADLRHPDYVRMRGPLDSAKEFDAAFFGFSPRDAAIMDPQHRHFIEVAWEALEHAGYDPSRFDGAVGVFGGSGHNSYMPYNLMTNPDLMESVGFFLVRHTSNDKDFLVTRVSYLFDLKGPAINVQTACSTSLVGVHLGVQSLLNGESDMVLAGGATIDMPLDRGYFHKEGEILSKDGHCRAFDAESSGTVFGSGAGVVVLKRLDDALEDRDTIHAVIRGTAINNDGSNKVGYLAPSVDGQAAAVGEAIAVAGIDPETIGFIECHGTGTEIGDPIEVAALNQVFRAQTDKTEFCALGSVKTNIGHLDTAAGVTSFIKAVLALKNRIIPPTVHFEKPNPRIDFEGSPFFVNGDAVEWTTDGGPRRAGVSSLGVGGTNAHVILEEAPAASRSGDSRSWQLLPLSAKGPAALDDATRNLAGFLDANPDVDLADVAFTLQSGRQALDVRRFAVVDGPVDGATVLSGEHPKRLYTGPAQVKDRSVVFMFPGQGAQYPNMGRDLYRDEPVFRACVDECAAVLEPLIGFDVRTVLYPDPTKLEWATEQLTQTATTQPAIFTIEYAMAKLWMSWGITPSALIGHSIGEYAAACLAGVFSLADALTVVATRGQLMQELPSGAMLAIPQAADVVRSYLSDGVSLAALNGPEFSVVAGPAAAIDSLESKLADQDIAVRRLHTSHAFHSSMMDPMLQPFADVIAGTERHEAQIPYVSNVTGTWITPEEISDPQYWAGHVRGAVDFLGGLTAILAADADAALLEVGPGRTLSTFAKQLEGPHRKTVSTSMRHATADADDVATALSTLGELWTAGAVRDWTAFQGAEQRRRIPLPTYPFQHEEFWVEPGESVRPAGHPSLGKKPRVEDWFYIPTWKQTPMVTAGANPDPVARWLVFLDEEGIGSRLAETLRSDCGVTTVVSGDAFESRGSGTFVVDPNDPADYLRLMRELAENQQLPDGIAYLWPLSSNSSLDHRSPEFESAQVGAFYGQLHLAQALAAEGADDPIQWWVVSNHAHAVAGEAVANPLEALAMGPVKVIGQEYPNIMSHNLDVAWPCASPRHIADLIAGIADEIRGHDAEEIVAHRGRTRWVRDQVAAPLEETDDRDCLIKDRGIYLITGGTGGIGLEVAAHLAATVSARLVLVARTALPAARDWGKWLGEHRDNDPTSRKIRKLQAIEAAGGEVMVRAADVTDAEQMGAVVAAAIERFGAIDGVFHAAGHLADGLISMKDQTEAASVLAAKVTGTLVIEEALEDHELDFFALFSSVSAVVGTAGQVDYAAANSFLNAYAHHRMAQDDRVTVAIGWGPWQSVGMTLRTAVGLGLVDDEDNKVATVHSLLDRWDQKDDEDVFETEMSTATHWLLDEHRAPGGVGLMPGTGYLDIVVAAHDQRAEASAFEMADVFFMAPFMVADEASATLRVSLSRDDDDFVISSALGATSHEHARGQIRTLDDEAPASIDVEAIRARCQERSLDFERFDNPQLVWGPRWNVLRRLEYGEHEALATLAIPAEFSADLGDHRLHPAILDLATGCAQDLMAGFSAEDDFFVPFSYGRLRCYRPLSEHMYSHVRIRPAQDRETAVFDISLFGSDGEPAVEIDGFVMRRAVGEIAAAVEPDRSTAPADPLLESIENGIGSDEGMQALRRVLSVHAVPEITVVSQDLHALAQRAAEARGGPGGDESGTGISHQRPDVSTSFVAPQTDREKAIATIWEEMLGLEGVGVHDDFFELGGHSLLLTQAITRIKKLTEADISLFTLFEAPTITEVIVELEKAEDEIGPEGGAGVPTLARVSRDGYRTKVGSLRLKGRPENDGGRP